MHYQALDKNGKIYQYDFIADAGEDGVVGESIDMIICLFDLIFKTNPDITHEEITAYTEKKLKKWKTLYGEHHYE